MSQIRGKRSQNLRQIEKLDGATLVMLSSEPNSSKYAIDGHNRGIQELGDLSELPKLCSLDVSFNKIKSLKKLKTAKQLRECKLYNNLLTSMDGLMENTNLEVLLLGDNQIEEISSDLLSLVKLKSLWLNGNLLSTVDNLRSCRLLTYLDLSRNALQGSAASGLDNLVNLEYLNLSDNHLTSIGNLLHLIKLEELDLGNNKFGSIAGIYPPNLSVLRLNGNQLQSLDGINSVLPKLNELYIYENHISDVQVLARLCPSLESLDARNNDLEEVEALTVLSILSNLQDLWVKGNPCCSLDSFISDIGIAFPNLMTLDDLTDAKLKQTLCESKEEEEEAISAEKAKAINRPKSSQSSRPTSASRPPTPVFQQPLERHGNLLKIATPREMEEAQANVVRRIEDVKQMLHDNDRKKSFKSDQRRKEINDSGLSDKAKDTNSAGTSTLSTTLDRVLPTQRSKVLVSCGTDPIYHLELNEPSTSNIVVQAETQTPRQLPPAPMEVSTGDNNTEEIKVDQVDPQVIENEMKNYLLKHATEDQDHEFNNNESGQMEETEEANELAFESPGIQSIKMAERKLPPKERAQNRYKSFHLPGRKRVAAL